MEWKVNYDQLQVLGILQFDRVLIHKYIIYKKKKKTKAMKNCTRREIQRPSLVLLRKKNIKQTLLLGIRHSVYE